MRGRAPASAAVMARRNEGRADSLDYYPTPPGATRALLDWLEGRGHALSEARVFEPAAGGGHMAQVLAERFAEVTTADIVDYGYPLNCVGDFLRGQCGQDADWLITNPPFVLFDDFAIRAVRQYPNVALLARLQALEGQRRFARLWSQNPPSDVLVFVNRVSMAKGGMPWEVGTSHSAVAYAWFVWRQAATGRAAIDWLHYSEDKPLL